MRCHGSNRIRHLVSANGDRLARTVRSSHGKNMEEGISRNKIGRSGGDRGTGVSERREGSSADRLGKPGREVTERTSRWCEPVQLLANRPRGAGSTALD